MNQALHDEIKKCGCELLERCLPRMVLTANSEASISQLISLAGQKRLHICPTGTGSSFPANYQPPPDAVFLLTGSMNQIVELRLLDGVAVVQAGLLAWDLREKLTETDLEFPESLANYRGTLGGAMLGPDPSGLRHAEMRRRLLGVEMVDPRGQIVKFGGGSVKNVAGYDLWAFLVGTGGRFGVVTQLILNLGKMPLLPMPSESKPGAALSEQTTRWIYANLEKSLDPDGTFAR